MNNQSVSIAKISSPLRGALAVLAIVLMSGGNIHSQSPVDGFTPSTNGPVFAVAVQQDGRIVIGGFFTSVQSGTSANVLRSRIARLNHDGTIDTTFDPGASPNQVSALLVQPDGKIIVGGDFAMLGGGGFGSTPRSKIGRLNPDGSIDPTFNPGANGPISALFLQPDGKILVGGSFTRLGNGGTAIRNRIARLNPDGTLDQAFNPGANDPVHAFSLQKDGKILAVGGFTKLGGGGSGTLQRNFIARINPDGGVDTSFNPGATSVTRAVVVQPDGKIVVGGEFTGLGGGAGSTPRNFIGRLNPNGEVDLSFGAQADSAVSILALETDGSILVGGVFSNLGGQSRLSLGRIKNNGLLDQNFNPMPGGFVWALAIQPDRKIVVGGSFGSFNGVGGSNMGRLYPDGSLDRTLNPAQDGAVFTVAFQPDGKFIIGGTFRTVNGFPHSRIARLNADGSLDNSFNPQIFGGNFNQAVFGVAVQPDGKILVGGEFTNIIDGSVGTNRQNIARLNPDGTVDMGFDPGANNIVRTFAMQIDGRIIVGGDFTALGDNGTVPRQRLARLNADGSLDPIFNPGASFQVFALQIQRDEKVLVGGNFELIGGGGTGTIPRNNIARLNADGSVDLSFDPGANFVVTNIGLQPDGKIVLVGAFTKLGGGGTGTFTRNRVGRINANGVLDEAFVGGANGFVGALALQADGKVVVAGGFTTLGESVGTVNRLGMGRFNADGSVDKTFDPGVVHDVESLALQNDGKIFLAGGFLSVGSELRNSIARLTNTGPAAQSLEIDETNKTITWFNQGTGPQAGNVLIDSSLEQVNFTPLGVANPLLSTGVEAAWKLSYLSIPVGQNVFLRSRGIVHVGGVGHSSSSSIVETNSNLLLCSPISVTPASTNLPGVIAGVSYLQQFNQTGVIGDVSFSVLLGRLPNGLTLNSATGLLSGTPTETGTFSFTVEATGANGCFGSTTYSLQVNCPTITLSPMPGALVGAAAGVAYTHPFTQVGGIGTIAFTKIAGSFPEGLSLSSSGQLSGRPLQTGNFSFTIQAMDQNGCFATASYSLQISCATVSVNPSNQNLPSAIAGTNYSQVFSQVGGVAPITFTTGNTTLPPGLSLNSNTGELMGIPTEIGAFSFQIVASDRNGCIGSRNYNLEIKSGIRISNSSISVKEDAGAINVMVTRTGDTSGVATVDYKTSDLAGASFCTVVVGLASSRCDYITTVGTLTFGVGETSKTISIPLIDDKYAEGTENFTLTLSNVFGAVLGSPASANLIITEDDLVNGTNPINTPNFFVRQHYLDFLNREPDPAGAAFWTGEITACGSDTQCLEVKRNNVSAAFFLSIEFQETGYFVYRIYKSGLGNIAGAPVPIRFGEFLRDTQEIGRGVQVGIGDWQLQLENNKGRFALAFVQRPDFQVSYPNSMAADQFVAQLDLNAGQVLTMSERADLVTLLQTAPADPAKRAQVLRAVAEDADLKNGEFNKAFVLMQYFAYLRRDPNDLPDADFGGFNFWLAKLNSFGGNFVAAEMVKAFVVSAEYRRRFGP